VDDARSQNPYYWSWNNNGVCERSAITLLNPPFSCSLLWFSCSVLFFFFLLFTCFLYCLCFFFSFCFCCFCFCCFCFCCFCFCFSFLSDFFSLFFLLQLCLHPSLILQQETSQTMCLSFPKHVETILHAQIFLLLLMQAFGNSNVRFLCLTCLHCIGNL
jgi:hypothetical protein